MDDRGGPRGQVLPMWIFAILATFALMFGALNYGNTLRWNIRAQNAADAAAQGLLTIQTQRWNEMNEALYAANVEEYRVRSILNSFLLTLNNTGPCAAYNNGIDPSRDCTAVASTLLPKYLQAVQRYSTDVAMLHAIAVNSTRGNWDRDSKALLTHIQKSSNCNDPAIIAGAANIRPDGSDCPFKISLVQATPRPLLGTVQYNAYTLLIPGLHASPKGLDTENADLWAPLKIDVVACAKVAPVIPSFWKYQARPYQAIARSAATSVMFVEDWFEPGNLLKPYTNPKQHFQNVENIVASPTNNSTDWYAVDFGGNFATANKTAGGFSNPFSSTEMSVRVGWWNAIPVRPFAAAPNTTDVCPP